MLALAFVIGMHINAPVMEPLKVEYVTSRDGLTREYHVKGGLGLNCTLAARFLLRCGLGEFFGEFETSQMHRSYLITVSKIRVTRKNTVGWLEYQLWFGSLLTKHLFPNRTIRFIDRGVKKDLQSPEQQILGRIYAHTEHGR